MVSKWFSHRFPLFVPWFPWFSWFPSNFPMGPPWFPWVSNWLSHGFHSFRSQISPSAPLAPAPPGSCPGAPLSAPGARSWVATGEERTAHASGMSARAERARGAVLSIFGFFPFCAGVGHIQNGFDVLSCDRLRSFCFFVMTNLSFPEHGKLCVSPRQEETRSN